MKSVITSILILFLTELVVAQEIDGPEEVDAGKLVVLDSSSIPSSGRNWKAVNVSDDDYVVVDDAQRLVFSTNKPGKYWFVFSYTVDLSLEIESLHEAQTKMGEALLVADIEEIKLASEALSEIITILVETKIQTESIIHEVIVTGSEPLPDDPDKPPKPLPEGKYGLAPISQKLALESVTEALRARSKDVAGVHRAISAQIAAGALKGGEEPILMALRDKLVSTLGDDFDGWKIWGSKIMGVMSEINAEGKLETDSDFAIAFSEIALGLEVIQ